MEEGWRCVFRQGAKSGTGKREKEREKETETPGKWDSWRPTKKEEEGEGLPVGQANTIVGNEQLEEGEREEFELKIKDNKKNRIN